MNYYYTIWINDLHAALPLNLQIQVTVHVVQGWIPSGSQYSEMIVRSANQLNYPCRWSCVGFGMK